MELTDSLTNEQIAENLNRIQQAAYSYQLTSRDRADWHGLMALIKSRGCRASKHRVMGRSVWSVVVGTKKVRVNAVGRWNDLDMSPEHKHLKGNCTTRALAYCLRGVKTYDEIESEQYALASETNRTHGSRCGWYRFGCSNYHRNSDGVWDRIVTSRGYKWIGLNTQIARGELGELLKGVMTKPIISESSGHVAIIDIDGSIVDNWDSRMGRVKKLLVCGDDVSGILARLTQIGIGYRSVRVLNDIEVPTI